MAEIVKEIVTTRDNANTTSAAPAKNEATSSQTVEYLIYFFFGALEILLAFRLIFKLTGASMGSAFVGLIYGITVFFSRIC